MTLTLTPDIETRLRTFAEDQGLDLTELHEALVTRALEDAEAELQDTLDGLDRSVADFSAGRWLTSEEFDRRLEARSAAAHARLSAAKLDEAKNGLAKQSR